MATPDMIKGDELIISIYGVPSTIAPTFNEQRIVQNLVYTTDHWQFSIDNGYAAAYSPLIISATGYITQSVPYTHEISTLNITLIEDKPPLLYGYTDPEAGTPLYGWTQGNVDLYTKSATPVVGMPLYDSTGVATAYSIVNVIDSTHFDIEYIPEVNEAIVNLTGSSAYEADTIFAPGRYRVEVAPGKTTGGLLSSSVTFVSNMDHTETITEPFIVRAYCGGDGDSQSGTIGTNPYTGEFKVNAVQNPSQVPGIDVNHIFGAGGGNNYFGAGWSSQTLGGGGGNCLGDGSVAPGDYGNGYGGAGSCCHLLPINGIFGTNYLRAYHAAALNGGAGRGSAYGGAGTGAGPNSGYATNWYTRGGNSPYGNGATAESSAGTGIGAGGKTMHGTVDFDGTTITSDFTIGAGAYFDGSQWNDEPGNITNTRSSYIKITYLGPVVNS